MSTQVIHYNPLKMIFDNIRYINLKLEMGPSIDGWIKKWWYIYTQWNIIQP